MAEPLTVLHLIDCLNPGGTESQLVGALRVTDRRRVRPLVAVFHEGGVLREQVLALGVPVSSFPLRVRLGHPNTALQIARLVALCRRERVAILHAHEFYGDLVGWPVARLAGVRWIAGRRDLAHWLTPMQRRTLGLACRAADAVVVNARAVAEVRDHGLGLDPRRVRLVHNGLDLDRFDREAALAPSPPLPWLASAADRCRSVAVVANLNLPDKGHADLLHALAMLPRALGARLLIVGDGRERPRLERLAGELGLGARVHFAGRRLDVPRLLARVGAACLPSWAEGFPNAVLEAMAAGLPTVATTVGACPSLIAHGVTGLLVPPRAPSALAAAVERILADEAAAQAMGARARDTVARRYTLRAAAAAYEAIYRALDDRRSPAAEGGAPQQSPFERFA